jgi:NADH-quinone oxidoreductase subunit A
LLPQERNSGGAGLGLSLLTFVLLTVSVLEIPWEVARMENNPFLQGVDMSDLVLIILVFLLTGVGFLLFNLGLGRLVRPHKPDAEKGTIYECGEPTIGPPWVQFDLRFYVVALLFVVFDVEMAFFFPWATVFGTANQLSQPDTPAETRAMLESSLGVQGISPESARLFAQIAFVDLLIFFLILLVGFAYLWSRGDLEWVRAANAQANDRSDPFSR